MKKTISYSILIFFLTSTIINSSNCARYFIGYLINNNCKIEIVESIRSCGSYGSCNFLSQTETDFNKCRSSSFSYHSLNSTCPCVINNSNLFTAIFENRTHNIELIIVKSDHVESNYSFEYNLFILPNTPSKGVHHIISSTILLC